MKRITVPVEDHIFDQLVITSKALKRSVGAEASARLEASYENQFGVVHRATVKHKTPCDLDHP